MAIGLKRINRVKVLGVRAAEQTKILATYNSASYCILIEYTDGSRELCETDAKGMNKYIYYIDMD